MAIYGANSTLNAKQSGDLGGLIVYGERYAAIMIGYDNGQYNLYYRYGWMKDSGQVDEYQQIITQLSSENCQLKVEVGLNGICQFYYKDHETNWISIEPSFAAGKGKWVGAKVGIFAATEADNTIGHCHFDYFKIS